MAKVKIGFRDLLGDRDLYKQMARIAIPVSLQGLITVGINLMDTVMLSALPEDLPLAASSLATQFINLFMICCMGIGMGASVLTSRYWGMREPDSLKKAITIMLRFVVIFSGVFTVATALAPELIMRLYTGDADLIREGAVYLKWMVPTYICMGLSLTCTIVLRTVGQVRVPMLTSVMAFFVNVFCNWVFIFGKLGAPRMEIAGAALGTLIARVFELVCICGWFFFKDDRINYRIKDTVMKCGDLLQEYIRICIPVLISDSLLALGNNAVAMVMGRISAEFVAANAVTVVVQQLSSVLTQGISNASGIITGHTMGRGEMEKAQKQGYAFLFMSLVIGCVAALIIFVLSGPIIAFYDVSPKTEEIAAEMMNAIVFIIAFQSMSSILTKGVLRAGGDTKFLMAGDILFLWVASIPLGYLSGLVFDWPPFWTYTFLKIDQVIKCVWCFFRLRSGKWMKKIYSAQGED